MPKKKTSKPKKKKVQKHIKPLKNQITKLLDEAKVKYEVIEHKLVYTAHDVGATTKKKLGEIAKVVLVKVAGAAREDGLLSRRPSSQFVLIVLPAGKYVDLKGIKQTLKAKKVSLANEKNIARHLKTKVGLLHPFGQLFKIQTLIDQNIAKAKKMITSAGSFTHSIEISTKDFEKLTNPIKGIFSKSKR